MALEMAANCIRSSFLNVNGRLTKLIWLGNGPTESPNKVILVIPGNPGLCSYYEDFMSKIYSNLEGKVSVWAISHFGHDYPKEASLASAMPSLSENEAPFTLKGQIQHKVDFIKEYVPTEAQLTLVGHSIGCRMILEALYRLEVEEKSETARRIKCRRAYMLFPTIERMYESPNGPIHWHLCGWMRPLAVLLTHLISLLPTSVLTSIIRYHFGARATPSNVQTTHDLIDARVVRNATFMAHDELATVKELPEEMLRKLAGKFKFYFGASDRWCPLQYREEMRAKLPEVESEVCEKGVEHAFVLGSSEVMAEAVAQWFKEDGLL